MALGDSNYQGGYQNNDNNKKKYDPTVYSPINFKNPTGVDPSMVGFSYWRNLLKINISPKLEAKPSDKYDLYDHDNSAYIHLSHMKARILYNEILKLLEDPNKLNSVGVNSGATGLITVSNGKEFGINAMVLVIRKMNEDGTVTSSYAYQFNNDSYYSSIRNFDEKSLKYDSIDCPNIEISALLDILKTFYEACTYAQAYAVVDSLKFDNSRTNTKLDLLMENAGIQKQSGNQSNGKSFFQRSSEVDSGNASASRNTTTLDDLANNMG